MCKEKGILIGGIEVGRYVKLTRAALARTFCFNENLTEVTCKLKNILGNDDTLAATLALTEEELEKKYNEIWVDPLGPLRVDSIFADMSRESGKNSTTIEKKGC